MRRSDVISTLWGRALRVVLAAVVAFGMVAFASPALADEQPEAASARGYRGFPDVQSSDWFATDEVLGYAVDHNLLNGYPDSRFGPHDTVTRGMVVTVLWRMAGSPDCTAGRFTDVDYNAYYGTAVSWARLTGVVSGYGDTNTFGPENAVTRQELAVMLSNYAERMGLQDVSSDCSALDAIAGADQVSSWTREQMGWAVDEKIIAGAVVDGVAWVNPQNPAERCEFAKMASALMRDVLGGDACRVEGAGVWHYEDRYISVDLPADWRDVIEPAPQGHTSGAFHVDFYYRGDYSAMVYRVDGSEGWNVWIDSGAFAFSYAQFAWDLSHGNDAYGWTKAQLDEVLDLTTGGKMTADDAASYPTAEAAGAEADRLADLRLFRAYVK